MANALRPAQELLTQYALYHRDKRNIATHVVGVPMIVFAVGVLLARSSWDLGGVHLTPAWCALALFVFWSLTRGELALNVISCALVGALMWLAHDVAKGSTAQWLAWGVGSFVLGWAIQFIGHYYEGRKPAFVDDITGLIVAPMFVVLEVLAPLGMFKGLMQDIEKVAGPVRLRNLAHPA
jgi:uncharacterized membrane protein YGL010W